MSCNPATLPRMHGVADPSLKNTGGGGQGSSYGPAVRAARRNPHADGAIIFSRPRSPCFPAHGRTSHASAHVRSASQQRTLLPNGRKLRSHARTNGAGKRRLQTSGRAGSSTQRQEATPFFSLSQKRRMQAVPTDPAPARYPNCRSTSAHGQRCS